MELKCIIGDNEMFIKNHIYKVLDYMNEIGIGKMYKIKPEVGEECFVPLDGELWEFGIVKENEMNKEKLQEIASTMTEEEFKNKYIIKSLSGEMLSIYGEKITCPNKIGLRNNLSNLHKCCRECKKCWENAIKELKFKEDNVKELNIIEASKMEVGTEFKVVIEGKASDYTIFVDNEYADKILSWSWNRGNSIGGSSRLINAKFIPLPKETEVDFMEAVKAFSEGKRIKSVWEDSECYYNGKQEVQLVDETEEPVHAEEISKAKWYIIND